MVKFVTGLLGLRGERGLEAWGNEALTPTHYQNKKSLVNQAFNIHTISIKYTKRLR